MDRFERDLRRLIKHEVAKLERKLTQMVARVEIEQVDDETELQNVKGTASAKETDDEVEVFQQGGVVHVPTAGAEGLVLSIGACGENRVAIGLSNRSARPTGLAAGETGLYSASESGGLMLLCRADAEVVITPGTKVRIEGDLHVTGEVVAKCDTTAVFVSAHLHPTALGPSGAPTPMPPVPPDLAIP